MTCRSNSEIAPVHGTAQFLLMHIRQNHQINVINIKVTNCRVV